MDKKAQVSRVINAIGSPALEAELGVTESAVRSAKWKGIFPAAWCPTVKKLAGAKNEECPDDLFNWKASVTFDEKAAG